MRFSDHRLEIRRCIHNTSKKLNKPNEHHPKRNHCDCSFGSPGDGWLDIDNGDLWLRTAELLGAREKESVVFLKVKGHAKWSEVADGVVSYAEEEGNDAADALVRRGAAEHVLDDGLVAKVRAAQSLTSAV